MSVYRRKVSEAHVLISWDEYRIRGRGSHTAGACVRRSSGRRPRSALLPPRPLPATVSFCVFTRVGFPSFCVCHGPNVLVS